MDLVFLLEELPDILIFPVMKMYAIYNTMYSIYTFCIFLKSKERVTFLSNIVEYIPGFTIPFEYRLPQNNQQLSSFTVAVYTPVKVDVSNVCIVCICTICGNLCTHRYPPYI